MIKLLSNFEQALASAPKRGGGLHSYLLKLANLGLIAGIKSKQ